jgi:phosphatidylethanolamine-binding protein (PEBP) family uncharacterized protein
VPTATTELDVVVEDPDAPGGPFVYWVLSGLDAGPSGLGQGAVRAGAREGPNDFGRAGWGGPCPPMVAIRTATCSRSSRCRTPLAAETGSSPTP